MPNLPHIELTEPLRAAMRAAAELAYPKEFCGLIVRDRESQALGLHFCANIAPASRAGEMFMLDPNDFVTAEDLGEVVAVVHSHPDACANPSMADRLSCERSCLPWFIVGWPSGAIVELQPDGWEAPLIGREFVFGVLDCYTLIQDYYLRVLGIALPDFDRQDDFWKKTQRPDGTWAPGQELYLEGFSKAGFVAVAGEPQLHDVILMQVASDVTNHGAVYVGDGLMLHHLYGRPSCRDPYAGAWQRCTRRVVRHQALVGAPA